MPYALVPTIVTGIPRPTSKAFLGYDSEPGCNLVRVRPGLAILWTPTVTLTDRRALVLADDALDTLNPARRTQLADALGGTYTATDRLGDIVWSHFRTPPLGSATRPLQPTIRGRYELWLGPGGVQRNLLKSESGPAQEKFSQDIQDTFDRANGAFAGSTASGGFTWSLAQGISAQINILSNLLRSTRSGADVFQVGLPSQGMDTVNHYAQLDLVGRTFVTGVALAFGVGVRIRFGTGAAGEEGYGAEVAQTGASTGWRRLYDFADDSNLTSDTTLTSPTATLYLEFDGSSYVVKVGGSTIFSGTDTTYSTYKNTVLTTYIDTNNSNIIDVDNFRAADLVAAGYTLDASGGAYALTGTAATLRLARLLGATGGSYAMAGSSAGLRAGRRIDAAAGSYVLSGAAATLLAGRRLDAVAGSHVLTGSDAALLLTRLLDAAPGSYILQGTAAGLVRGYTLAADGGVYALAGSDIALRLSRLLDAGAGAYAVAGQNATLIYSAAPPSESEFPYIVLLVRRRARR